MSTSDVSGVGGTARLGATIAQGGERIATLRSQQRLLARQMQQVAGSTGSESVKVLRSDLIQAQFQAIDLRIQQVSAEVQAVRSRARLEALQRQTTPELDAAAGPASAARAEASGPGVSQTAIAARAFLNLTETPGSIDVEA